MIARLQVQLATREFHLGDRRLFHGCLVRLENSGRVVHGGVEECREETISQIVVLVDITTRAAHRVPSPRMPPTKHPLPQLSPASFQPTRLIHIAHQHAKQGDPVLALAIAVHHGLGESQRRAACDPTVEPRVQDAKLSSQFDSLVSKRMFAAVVQHSKPSVLETAESSEHQAPASSVPPACSNGFFGSGRTKARHRQFLVAGTEQAGPNGLNVG